jgi:hypothetical protein
MAPAGDAAPMPRGSGHPDLSQRPRREAPGMLTGMAILERELGLVEYARHRAQRRLEGRLAPSDARALRQELAELDARRAATLRLLDDAYQEYDERLQRGAAGIHARAAASPRRPRDD